MKLFHKIFLCFVIIFSITFQVTGYMLINYAYENAIEQEKQIAFQSFQYNRYILQSVLYFNPDIFVENEVVNIEERFTLPVAVYGSGNECYFSNIAVQTEELDFSEEDDDRKSFRIYEKEGKKYIFVCDYIDRDGSDMYFVTQTDISSVIDSQKNMIDYFRKIYLCFLLISFPVIFILTKVVTRHIEKVRNAAKRIAGGEYSERICVKGNDEISELASDFNRMAEQVEEKIIKLSDVARQKEDFAANFAHEMKTPLTSVIGYADMLYQNDLPRKDVKAAAEYILDEGMRMESLALKLMDMFVMDKKNFILEKLSVKELFSNLVTGIEAVCKRNETILHMDIDEHYIDADYDLFKTMILNLVDNSVKAECSDIWIYGRKAGEDYRLTVEDNGKGIPPEELGRITEAFYMVDKSRSGKQHSAGLGMALVLKIVDVHKGKLEILSDGETGTKVIILLCGQEGDANE